MRLSDLTHILTSNPDKQLRFALPSGELTPAHAHVTEVARVDKKFIDCGGTFRNEAVCRLQTWVADDYHHRLVAKKLVGILEKAGQILGAEDLEVDVEHDLGFVSQFPVDGARCVGEELIIQLVGRNTACLAPEKCCPPQPTEAQVITLGRKK